MTTQRIRTIHTITLFFLDTVLITAAFVLAHKLRVSVAWPAPLARVVPLSEYAGLLIVHVLAVLTLLVFYRQYYLPRAVSRVDMLYYVFAAVSIGTMMGVAVSSFIFKTDESIVNYPRAMIAYAWLLTIVLLVMGRILHQLFRNWLQKHGWGKDRLLIVGTGDTARSIIQRIQWSPQLGYELVGIVNGTRQRKKIEGVPVVGQPEDLPDLIEKHSINEVIIAMPEKGHREIVRVISYCERGRVSIKIFPDVFQFITSDAGIDHLGGLPLLSVRDFAFRGYLLIFKRLMDMIVAGFGLVIFSPLMLLTAVAIKLESPGPAFFVQERMGLDGEPFMLIKFRSMRRDAEKYGPGWTVNNDPRQTKLGKLIRRIEVDELPNLINVFIGEMSLVGPRPEQAHYVEQFRQRVPRYMDRHREKGGMTGWAQVNGLRGDTSITERTKYDLWYSENWSIWLDIKILIRTLWQIVFEREKENGREVRSAPLLADIGAWDLIRTDETPTPSNGHEAIHPSPEFTSIQQNSPKN
jgi:exopolysaccharide biosynthesis polyprenyl glycosylphosphotransferase